MFRTYKTPPFPNTIIGLKEGYNNMKKRERSQYSEFIKR
nr:MAG TPA: hypothetical protein [Caudoviricetes sp.]